MNFGKCRPLVVRISKAQNAGGLLWTILFRVSTVGCSNEFIVPRSGQPRESENAGPSGPAQDRGNVEKAGTSGELFPGLNEDVRAESLSHEEVFLAEEHRDPSYGFNKGTISAQPTSVRALYADRGELCAQPRHFAETSPYGRRASHGRTATVFESRVSEHA